MQNFDAFSEKERLLVCSQLDEEQNFYMKVLRGHLLIEQKLNELLALLVRNPSVLEASNAPRIDFFVRVHFAKALAPELTSFEWFWPAVEKLNNIRNHLTHSLESPKFEKSIDDFILHLKNNDAAFKKNLESHNVNDKQAQCVAGITAVYAFFTLLNHEEKQKNV